MKYKHISIGVGDLLWNVRGGNQLFQKNKVIPADGNISYRQEIKGSLNIYFDKKPVKNALRIIVYAVIKFPFLPRELLKKGKMKG